MSTDSKISKQELWQLYDAQANPLAGKGATKDDIFGKGLLHGAAHVWIWRDVNGAREVLLQKRAGGKRTWPHRYDISAAGHIDLGEEPITAALRETTEEVGLTFLADQLKFVGIERMHLKSDIGAIENEFQWVYHVQVGDDTAFTIQQSELDSLLWKTIDEIRSEYNSDAYVPHGSAYYERVLGSIGSA